MAAAAHSGGAPPPRGAGGARDWISVQFGRLLTVLNSIGSAWIFALMLLIDADAFGRTLFAAPIDGVPEMIELSIVGIVFLQLGDSTRRGRLTRSDGFYNFMRRRLPIVGRGMGLVFDLLGAAFMGLILWGSFPLFFESWEGDFYVGVEGLFIAPTWPIKLIILIGCMMTLLQFLAFGWRHLVPRPAVAEPEAVTF